MEVIIIKKTEQVPYSKMLTCERVRSPLKFFMIISPFFFFKSEAKYNCIKYNVYNVTFEQLSRSNGYSACALLVIGVLVFVYRQDVSFQVGRAKHHLQASERTPLVETSSRTYTTTVEIKDPKKKKQEGASLFKVLARTYGPDFLKAWGCKFIYDLLQMASPSLLR